MWARVATHGHLKRASMHLTFKKVCFQYEGTAVPVFESLDWGMSQGWCGIVGANGAGKSTLLRLAINELTPLRGHIARPGPGLYGAQRTDLPPAGLPRLLLAADSAAQRLKLELGLQPDWAHRWSTLSHGERKRAQIAVLLHHAPMVLAVDEPTNHLDQAARDQVLHALAGYQGFGLLVSHDRDLLDALCAQCLFLNPPGLTVRPGSYTQGLREAEQERLAQTRQWAKADREVRELRQEQHLRRAQTAKQERQRSKRGLAKGDHDAKAKLDAARVSDSGSGQRLRQLDGRARQATDRKNSLEARRRFTLGIRLEGAASHRNILWATSEGALPLGGERRLWTPALVIHATDRIGIQGPNGTGKSTLLRHIVTDLERTGEKVAYLPQEIHAARGVEILREILRLSPDRRGNVLSVVRRLGSDPARVLQSQDPSPGEVRKLLLAACVDSRPSVLVMDEPTNHLDLPSVECLEEALEGCAMALVLVSHDRRFLSRLTQRKWIISKTSEEDFTLVE